MYRTNTPADVANTGRVKIDTGGGVTLEVPVLSARDHGDLDITSNLTGVTSGNVLLARIGWQVWLDFQDVVFASPGSLLQWNNAIPSGYRPARARADLPMQGRASGDTAGPVRVDGDGALTIYRPAGTVRGLVSWFTREHPPA